MGTSALRPKPTVHNGPSNTSSKPQDSDIPPSPVSPLDSNGETWKYPPNANAHPKGLWKPDQIPLEQVPAKTRLSRPFEQPYPIYTSERRQVSAQPAAAPMQANIKRADSHLRSQPAQVPKKMTAPPPLAIPKPAHQPRRQHEPNPVPEDRQNDQTGLQRSARHQGWNPLKEPARQQDAAHDHGKDDQRAHGRGRDLERQGDVPKVKDRHGLVEFILWMIVGVLGAVAVLVLLKTTWGKG